MLLDRYADFRVNVENLSKNLAKFENQHLSTMGIRGVHVLCLYHLDKNPAGMTASRLAAFCDVDKALISRIIGDLLSLDFIRRITPETVRYRARYVIAPNGRACLRQVTRWVIETIRQLKDEISDQELATFFKVMILMNRHLSDL